jgi:hypothetical protein
MRYHHDNPEQPRSHLAGFVAAYNFARTLKIISSLTSYEYICKIWIHEPESFIFRSIHQRARQSSTNRSSVQETAHVSCPTVLPPCPCPTFLSPERRYRCRVPRLPRQKKGRSVGAAGQSLPLVPVDPERQVTGALHVSHGGRDERLDTE